MAPLRRFRSLSVRMKIILIVVSLLVASMSATALLVRDIASRNIVANQMRTAEVLTASIVHDIKYEFDADRYDYVQNIVAKYMTYYRVISHITYYNPDGVNLADSDSNRIGEQNSDPDVQIALDTATPRLYVSNDDWHAFEIRSVAPVLRGSRVAGVVTMDISVADLHATLSAIIHRVAIIMAAQVLVASLLLFILLDRAILRRITSLRHATERIASGDYTVQAMDQGGDEVGDLARAFNQMATEVSRAKTEIEEHNRTLEDRVAAATGELQKTYDDLKNTQGQLVLNEKMASLGVLIAGIAHEINTPVGAILNVSRQMESRIRSMPEILRQFRRESTCPDDRIVACLEEIRKNCMAPRSVTAYRETRVLEQMLQNAGVTRYRELASQLMKLNMGSVDKARAYLDCLTDPKFFRVAESFASIAQAASIAETSSRKIGETIRALRYYSHGDRDRIEPIDVNESIHTGLVLLRNALKHTVTLETDLADDLPRISGTNEIHQVWTNLLINACDAVGTSRGAENGKIVVSSREIEGKIRVRVADNGPGVPEDIQGKIFDPFFTTKDIGSGTGLGLSIVSGLVKKHGGEIRLHSRPGETVFEVDLPIPEAAAKGGDSVRTGTDPEPVQ
ncbi:MAG: HAMP domain-containing protein [Candidatus Eisenbacteria bacterium]|uniref:histidine kinase n=1 Tax=Eiseniibacteriota bacterium TaxID=2212470 RepID=A0A956NAN9_UNCEI|nr:HAMP domain-containing protein [Candidatus Eisenbacteria bacterium]